VSGFTVTEFGAVSDGKTDSSSFIQKSIDAAAAAGGSVHFPPGVYVSGPITLYSGVSLHLAAGALLSFHPDPSRYPPFFTRWEGVECWTYRPMILCEGCTGVRISGAGIIDGNGAAWWETLHALRKGSTEPARIAGAEHLLLLNRDIPPDSGGGGREYGFLRPPLIQCTKSSRIRISGITCRNSAFWNTHILYCTDVKIEGARFENPADTPNTDGLAIDSSVNVSVTACTIDVGDDCIGLKAGAGADGRRVNRATRNVVIRDCTMNHGHGGVVCGSETAGGISDVLIERCTFSQTDRGIRLKSRRGRGGYITRILVRNVRMHSVHCPLVANLYYRCGAAPDDVPYLAALTPQEVTEETPVISEISVDQLTATDVSSAAAVLIGLPESPIRNVMLSDFAADVVPTGVAWPVAMDFADSRFDGAGIIESFVEGFQTLRVSLRGHHGPACLSGFLEGERR